jgi:predicted phosphoribosyltransferase
MEPRPFHDRTEARRLLAGKLTAYANLADVIVLDLPRGGVPGMELVDIRRQSHLERIG